MSVSLYVDVYMSVSLYVDVYQSICRCLYVCQSICRCLYVDVYFFLSNTFIYFSSWDAVKLSFIH